MSLQLFINFNYSSLACFLFNNTKHINSLNGNPTLGRLRQVAKVLGVEISELFKSSTMTILNGFIEYNGEVIKISSPEDLFRLTDEVKRATLKVSEKE